MSAIARDGVASDHLVYAWPFPIGPDCEVACGEDEQVVMCPAWIVGDRLGPGRHLYRTPDPSRPVAAYFVLVAPVEVSFDMTTSFLLPSNGQPIRLRATGSMQVRCSDPGLLIAQFVGLPFDSVNDGIMRSVSRSVERMIARLLTRRVVMAGTAIVVTDTTMHQAIIEELVAYNPTAGAVFGVELIRMGHLTIIADDGSKPHVAMPNGNRGNGNGKTEATARLPSPTVRGLPPAGPRRQAQTPTLPPPLPIRAVQTSNAEIKPPGPPQTTASGEIGGSRAKTPSGMPPLPKPPELPALPPLPAVKSPVTNSEQGASSAGEIVVRAKSTADMPAPRHASPIEIPQEQDITQPSMQTPLPGTLRVATATPVTSAKAPADEGAARGSIMGIGMSSIGSGAVAGEIPTKVKPGSRVLVPGPNGLMQSATVRQLLQGYYELEVGSSGETIWVPINGVVPSE